ncbi:MAG: hypothetical protein HQK79_14590 [Desulfobacterales bacterium]|nr:hypothetical protein [Desulfobacterales bacterium]
MKIFCILGDERVFSSKSTAMFTAVLKRIGIKGAYTPFKVEAGQIGAALQSLRVLNIDGANIAVPYKESVLPHLDILSEGANIIGAVNTIVRNKNVLKGYNTNAIGFMDTLEEIGYNASNKSAIVFGTGGLAKAVVFILNWLRSKNIIVAGRNKDKIQKLVSHIAGEPMLLKSMTSEPISANIIINATSVSSPDESPEMAALINKIELKDCELLIDLNYGRNNNFWKDMADAKGIKFIDGVNTLSNQARRSFALWTKIDVDPMEFRKAVYEVL